jgi:hypothetical protein
VPADPLALTVFDGEHSQGEERWFTLSLSSQGRLLAVSQTHAVTGAEAPMRGYLGARGRALGASAVRERAALMRNQATK